MNLIYRITVLCILTSCGISSEEKNGEPALQSQTVTLTPAQVKNADLSFSKLEKKPISRTLQVSGKIEVPPQNMVSVSVPLGGYLKSSQLLPGMHVRKGEVIAVMEDQQYIQLQQDYLIGLAKLKYSEKEFERQRELNISKATSDKIFQQAEAEYTTQKVTVKSLSEKLKLIGIDPVRLTESNISKSINLLSPIDGFVTHVNVNIGKYSQPSEVLFELVNPTDIHLALTIFEKDLDDIFIGQKLMAFNNRDLEKKHACEIILIGKNLTVDRNTEVHCHFEKYDQTLIPGMFMNAEIEIQNQISEVLPDESIVIFEGKNYVFVQKSSTVFNMVEVQTGISQSGFTEILQGTNSFNNKNIAAKGAYTLLMQLKNTVEE